MLFIQKFQFLNSFIFLLRLILCVDFRRSVVSWWSLHFKYVFFLCAYECAVLFFKDYFNFEICLRKFKLLWKKVEWAIDWSILFVDVILPNLISKAKKKNKYNLNESKNYEKTKQLPAIANTAAKQILKKQFWHAYLPFF